MTSGEVGGFRMAANMGYIAWI